MFKYREDKVVLKSAKVPPFGTIPYYGTDSAEVAIRLPFPYLPNVEFKQTHDLRGFDFSADDTYLLAAGYSNNSQDARVWWDKP